MNMLINFCFVFPVNLFFVHLIHRALAITSRRVEGKIFSFPKSPSMYNDQHQEQKKTTMSRAPCHAVQVESWDPHGS